MKNSEISLFSGLDGTYEASLRGGNVTYIAGIDEVGRGPLAGPVVAAAVVLDVENIPQGLDDSKNLSAKRREIIFEHIIASSHIGLSFVPASLIDLINIRQATLLAMRQALAALPVQADYALIDGRDVPPRLSCPAEAFIKGDGRIASIAAASIVAKVMRDRFMKRAAQDYPAYHFERNAGYGTRAHLLALEKYGPSPFHRKSFDPLKSWLTKRQ
jgi:ribonuclease HII